MERERVESASLRSVGYDAGEAILEVEFSNGRVYQYYLVPERVHRSLLEAASKGAYFNEHVRDAGYPFRRVG